MSTARSIHTFLAGLICQYAEQYELSIIPAVEVGFWRALSRELDEDGIKVTEGHLSELGRKLGVWPWTPIQIADALHPPAPDTLDNVYIDGDREILELMGTRKGGSVRWV